jgi:signal peptidase I
MTPAIAAGDHIFAEGFTYWCRKPRRGDVLVFLTDGIPDMPRSQQGQIYTKRLVGLPGETLHIEEGKLFVDGKPVTLSNAAGEIHYLPLPFSQPHLKSPTDRFTVPEGGYFVLGDNSTNSLDSRSWGVVPTENVIGRIWFCYWPLSRCGTVE